MTRYRNHLPQLAGDPAELGRLYGELKNILPQFNIIGGCCGTDHLHIARICQSI